ncbi:hypothetical protein PNOK_0693000 [Pyrrhoderma noxium]|uniref:Uncharacterized protein n=1 Tax=Pyrrhoderma noxium TaxID=2282107 RepID=A0A286UBE0_9AGAM|nr:hypothetical protein PNOK_0693000 [Pyrrhoderma noxium]
MVDIKSLPMFYPPDGLYYIFSRDFGHFWRQRSGISDGGILDCEPLESKREELSMHHRIWKMTTMSPANAKRGPRVILQSAQGLHFNAPEEMGCYVSKKSSKIIQSNKKASWILCAHGSKPYAYKILTSDMRLAINSPTHTIYNTKTDLKAEFHVTEAYDIRVYDPQWWYFIPVSQIDKFLEENGIRRLDV